MNELHCCFSVLLFKVLLIYSVANCASKGRSSMGHGARTQHVARWPPVLAVRRIFSAPPVTHVEQCVVYFLLPQSRTWRSVPCWSARARAGGRNKGRPEAGGRLPVRRPPRSSNGRRTTSDAPLRARTIHPSWLRATARSGRPALLVYSQ